MLIQLSDLSVPKVRIFENRALTKSPKLDDFSFSLLNDYLSDHMPLRTNFISLYVNLWEIGLSAPARKAVNGTEGHLYSKEIVENYLGLHPLKMEERYELRSLLLGNQEYWKTKGIPYFVALAPNKSTLYPEFLPSWVKKKQNWRDPLISLLKESPLHFLDFTEILNNHNQLLFFDKTYDIEHWNANALDIAYKIIVEKLKLPSSAIKPYSIDNKKVIAAYGEERVPWLTLNQSGIKLLPAKDYKDMSVNERRPHWKPTISINPKGEKSLLFITDSYLKTTHQTPFPNSKNEFVFPLIHNVQKLIHIRTNESLSLIQKIVSNEKPDMVFEVFAERQAKVLTQKKRKRS
jgi:hypothetical protein